MLWVLNGSALAVRERLVDYQRLSRILSAMGILCEGFTKGQERLLKAIEPLYEYPFLQKIHCILA